MKPLSSAPAFLFGLLAMQVPVASWAQDMSNEASDGTDSQTSTVPEVANIPTPMAIIHNDGGNLVTIAGPKLSVVPKLQRLYSCSVVDNGYWGILFNICHHEPSGKVIYEWSGNEGEVKIDPNYSVIKRAQASTQAP